MSKDWPFSFGLEEEFFLVHRDTGSLARSVPEEFRARCSSTLGPRVSNELLQSQVESNTSIHESASSALVEVLDLRRALAETAGDFGFALMAAGTHPLGDWREQQASPDPRHERLMEDFQVVAQRNLVCGLHVHVGIAPEIDRVVLMNRVLEWLPLFLALSTSSPFWAGKRTGMMSYRQAVYGAWPRTGLPDEFTTERSYWSCVDLLAELGSLDDARALWWPIRPSARLPTLELRIADACTHPSDAVCIAGLFRSLLRAAALGDLPVSIHDEATRILIEENCWRAKRYGLATSFIDVSARSLVASRDWVESFLSVVSEHARTLGCEDAIAHARVVMNRGTSAARQLTIYLEQLAAGVSPQQALQLVIRYLLEGTSGDGEDPACGDVNGATAPDPSDA